MGLLNPGQNFDHMLDVVSGYDGMHDLQFAARPALFDDPTNPELVFDRGACISLNAAGAWVPGVVGTEMPCWSINATGDFDVNSDIGNISGGVVAAFVATGGYELKTTEYDTDDAGSYVPNSSLIAGAGVIATADADRLGTVDFLAAPGLLLPLASNVIGVVSQGEVTEVYNQLTLQFWPVYCPAHALV
jgi:hypothetical protein